MLRVEVEAVIISEGEREAVQARNGGWVPAPGPAPVLIALVGDHPVVGRALLQKPGLGLPERLAALCHLHFVFEDGRSHAASGTDRRDLRRSWSPRCRAAGRGRTISDQRLVVIGRAGRGGAAALQEEEPLRFASSESRAFLLGTCFGEGGGGRPGEWCPA